MHFTVQLFLHYGYWIMFGWVLVEQLGVPLPSSPILITAGTLTATHHMGIGRIVLAAMAGCAVADFIWFRLGGRYGRTVTRWMCKFSLGGCLLRAQDRRHSDATRTGRVAVREVYSRTEHDGSSAGWSKQDEVSNLLRIRHGWIVPMGRVVCSSRKILWRCNPPQSSDCALAGPFRLWLVVLVVIGIIVARIIRQQQFLRKIRTLRIEPTELKAMIDRGDNPYIIDLRHPLDILPDPRVLPGAVCLPPERADYPQFGDSAGPRHRAVLHLPQRGHQRKGRTDHAPIRHRADPPPARRLRWLEGAGLSPGRNLRVPAGLSLIPNRPAKAVRLEAR